uniref:Uncharacterized protein n=1 Tax=Clytia hemisphaerica TaxID=252671 RepID=A0A7M5V969_9CNID
MLSQKLQQKSKSLDVSADTSVKRSLPKKQISMTDPLQSKRQNFLRSHIDLDSSYNMSGSPPGHMDTVHSKMTKDATNFTAKQGQCSNAEKGLLRRFMHVQ